MGKHDTLARQILDGSADANISFDDLCKLLRRLEFDERTSGSHHTSGKQAYQKRSICNVMGIRLNRIKYAKQERYW